jgi:hypothetical protein
MTRNARRIPLFFVFPQTATNYLTFALNRFKTSRIPESTVFVTPGWSSARGLYKSKRERHGPHVGIGRFQWVDQIRVLLPAMCSRSAI